MSNDDGSTTILLGALWDTEGESLNHDSSSRIGRCDPNHASGVLKSCNLQAPSSQVSGMDATHNSEASELALDIKVVTFNHR